MILRAKQHFVMRLARRDHGETIFVAGHADINQHRARMIDHLIDGVIQMVGMADAQAMGAERLGQGDEIGERLGVASE